MRIKTLFKSDVSVRYSFLTGIRIFVSQTCIFLLLLATSCTPQWLFQQKEGFNMDNMVVPENPPQEHVIQPDDKLTVSVWGHDNLGVGSSFSVYTSNEASGRFINLNNKGELTLPLVGKVKVSGLTIREADLYLSQLFSKYIKDPIIHLRVLNHTVTILGEVRAPGNYNIDKEEAPLLESIGKAGGFTEYADKSAIMVLRKDEEGKVVENEIDLTDLEALYSRNMILKSRDIIYVRERRAKQFDRVNSSLVPFAGFVGTAMLMISLFGNKNN